MMKHVFLLIVTLLSCLSGGLASAVNSPLVGNWRWDNDKTLQNLVIPKDGSLELRKSANRAKKFVEAVKNKLNSNMTLSCSDSSCIETIFDKDNKVLSTETVPYEVIQSGNNFLIINNFRNSGTSKLIFEGSSFYVEVKVGEYTYKDYFTKINAVDAQEAMHKKY